MGYQSAKTTSIEGIQLKIVTGEKNQTINIFDDSDTNGNYREVYRIKKPELFIDTLVQVEQNCLNLAELDQFLAGREAVKEGPRKYREVYPRKKKNRTYAVEI